jgi:hypothetical protein
MYSSMRLCDHLGFVGKLDLQLRVFSILSIIVIPHSTLQRLKSRCRLRESLLYP